MKRKAKAYERYKLGNLSDADPEDALYALTGQMVLATSGAILVDMDTLEGKMAARNVYDVTKTMPEPFSKLRIITSEDRISGEIGLGIIKNDNEARSAWHATKDALKDNPAFKNVHERATYKNIAEKVMKEAKRLGTLDSLLKKLSPKKIMEAVKEQKAKKVRDEKIKVKYNYTAGIKTKPVKCVNLFLAARYIYFLRIHMIDVMNPAILFGYGSEVTQMN